MNKNYIFLIVCLFSIGTMETNASSKQKLNETLIAAINANNTQKVQEALAAGADSNAKNAYKDPALHVAIRDSKNLEIVKHLLDHKADPNATDKEGNTALHIAARYITDKNTAPEMINLLMDYGAKVAQKNTASKTPATIAREFRNKEATQTFSKRERKRNDTQSKVFQEQEATHINRAQTNKPKAIDSAQLFTAIQDLDLTRVTSLLDNGANVNITDSNKNTPLHYAATQNNIALIQLLLASGANSNAKNNLGKTPFDNHPWLPHYQTLQLNPFASYEEIKNNYKKLAFQHHPDKHVGEEESIRKQHEEVFKEINNAYEALTNVYQDESIHTNLHKASQN